MQNALLHNTVGIEEVEKQGLKKKKKKDFFLSVFSSRRCRTSEPAPSLAEIGTVQEAERITAGRHSHGS